MLCIQMLCDRAKAAINHPEKPKIVTVVKHDSITVLAGDITHMDFKEAELILMNLEDVSIFLAHNHIEDTHPNLF